MITIGGDAELELVDSMNPFTEGILFRSVLVYLILFQNVRILRVEERP